MNFGLFSLKKKEFFQKLSELMDEYDVHIESEDYTSSIIFKFYDGEVDFGSSIINYNDIEIYLEDKNE